MYAIGAVLGLMGAVASSALAAGGEVIGVIPEKLIQRELGHGGVDLEEIVWIPRAGHPEAPGEPPGEGQRGINQHDQQQHRYTKGQQQPQRADARFSLRFEDQHGPGTAPFRKTP